MTDPWCCYIWCAMDPINIPPILVYIIYMDPMGILIMLDGISLLEAYPIFRQTHLRNVRSTEHGMGEAMLPFGSHLGLRRKFVPKIGLICLYYPLIDHRFPLVSWPLFSPENMRNVQRHPSDSRLFRRTWSRGLTCCSHLLLELPTWYALKKHGCFTHVQIHHGIELIIGQQTHGI